jgi:hypothetical protein
MVEHGSVSVSAHEDVNVHDYADVYERGSELQPSGMARRETSRPFEDTW